MTLGSLVKRYRKAGGMTQRELAHKAQVRQALISELETGKKHDVLFQTVQRLARALDVTLEQLGEQAGSPTNRATPQQQSSTRRHSPKFEA